MMVFVQVSPSATQTRDIVLPDTVAHRSVPGDTLILQPGVSCELTSEEWDYIQESHPEVAKDVRVIQETGCSSKST